MRSAHCTTLSTVPMFCLDGFVPNTLYVSWTMNRHEDTSYTVTTQLRCGTERCGTQRVGAYVSGPGIHGARSTQCRLTPIHIISHLLNGNQATEYCGNIRGDKRASFANIPWRCQPVIPSSAMRWHHRFDEPASSLQSLTCISRKLLSNNIWMCAQTVFVDSSCLACTEQVPFVYQ